MASPGNRHCANCIGTLSFHIGNWNRHSDVMVVCTSVNSFKNKFGRFSPKWGLLHKS